MTNISNASLFDLLPMSLSSPELKALDHAITNQVNKIIQYAEKARLWSRNLETLDSKELDVLAHELKAPYYDESLTIETKRKLVKNALPLYSTMGTPSAVENLIDIVFGTGELKEWFEYDGEPHMFKVVTDNSATINSKADEFIRLLNSVKRLSSHLEVVEVVASGELEIIAPLISAEYDSGRYIINGNI